MGTSLITGIKLWKHKGKEWRPPPVEANEKSLRVALDFGLPDFV